MKPEPRTHPYPLPTLCVIVPALNEEASIKRCIGSVMGDQVQEVIVVDGGSHDRTVEIARRTGATVIAAARGRARQMNAGAARARADFLLFLHADCTLARGALPRLRRVLAAKRHRVGYFRQRIDGRHLFYRLQELGSNLRARWLARPYGDQAMFFSRSVFNAIGGFPDVPLMEDLYIARVARRFRPFLAMPETVTSSARRWSREGLLRRAVRNWSVALAEKCGATPGELLVRYEGQAVSPEPVPPPRAESPRASVPTPSQAPDTECRAETLTVDARPSSSWMRRLSGGAAPLGPVKQE